MKELTVPAKIEYMDEVLTFINAELENINCPIETQKKIDIASDEIFTNIASYAYPSASGNITIRINISGNPVFAEIQFIDNGMPYNPLEKEVSDIMLSAEERKIGGLGTHIVKKFMDFLNYKYKNNQNILTIKKLL